MMPACSIVLTGVTRGIGNALARYFAQNGHRVIGCGRSRSHIAALSRDLGAAHDLQVVDLAQREQLQAWCARVIERHGPPDFLINNAAMIHPNNPFWKIPLEQIDQVIDLNVKAVAAVMRQFIPGMIGRGRGVIVNLSSGAGRRGIASISGYCASKWAIEGLTRSLALELPSGMAAVPLSPGIVNTEMLQSTFGEDAHGYASPEEWVQSAGPYILGLGPEHNGQPLTVPDAQTVASPR